MVTRGIYSYYNVTEGAGMFAHCGDGYNLHIRYETLAVSVYTDGKRTRLDEYTNPDGVLWNLVGQLRKLRNREVQVALYNAIWDRLTELSWLS